MSQPPSPPLSTDLHDQESKNRGTRTCALVSLRRSSGPGGAMGNDWYRYEISTPGSPITGYRRGKKFDVLEYLSGCISQLDERLKSGKAIPWAPHGRLSVKFVTVRIFFHKIDFHKSLQT